MICKNCFQMSDDGTKFCPYCGHSFCDDKTVDETHEHEDVTVDEGHGDEDITVRAEQKPETPEVPPAEDTAPQVSPGTPPKNDNPAYRPDSVPQGKPYGYGNGYYGGYGYNYNYNNMPYTQYPPYIYAKPEKSPAAKFFSGIGHAVLYIILFYLSMQIVAVVYSVAVYDQVTQAFIETTGYSESDLIHDDVKAEYQMYYTGYVYSHGGNGIITIVSAGITLAALMVIASTKHRTFSDHVGFYPIHTPKVFLLIPLGIAMQLLVGEIVSIVSLLPAAQGAVDELHDTYSFVESSVSAFAVIADFIGVVIAAPLIEEIIFRGCVFTRLKRGMPTIAACVLSAFVFGLIHGILIAICYATVLGLMLAYMYDKFESVLASILLHFGFNVANYVPLLRADSTWIEVIVTFAGAAVVFVVCFAIIMLSDVSRKTNTARDHINNSTPPTFPPTF